MVNFGCIVHLFRTSYFVLCYGVSECSDLNEFNFMRKRILMILLAALLFAVVIVVCVLRWDAWFSNPAEAAYIVPQQPNNIILGFGDNYRQRTISWRSPDLQESVLLIDGDTIIADGKIIASRSGEAAFYRAKTSDLSVGEHRYSVKTGEMQSQEYSFVIQDDSLAYFLLFGDIQEQDTISPFATFCSDFQCNESQECNALPLFFAYIGDVIDRPTDVAWQIWFNSLHGINATTAHVAAVGNHEYLKGVSPKIDPRWTSVFSLPDNGSERQEGTTGYIDFPTFRLIVLNTQDLVGLSDYTIEQTWLNRALSEVEDKFKIVLMHHSVYSGAMQRENPLIFTAFRRTLSKADIVVAGHDHLYTRRANKSEKVENVSERSFVFSTPVFIITGTASKQYLPKCSPADQRLGSNTAFYEEFFITSDTLRVLTRNIKDGSVYDDLVIDRRSRTVVFSDSLPDEQISLPERYQGKNNVHIRRFENRLKARSNAK